MLFNIDNYNYPKEIKLFYKYTETLKFEEEPNYNFLYNLMNQLLEFHKVNNDSIFSWSKYCFISNKIPVFSSKSNLLERKSSSKFRLFSNIQNALSKKNIQENEKIEKIQVIQTTLFYKYDNINNSEEKAKKCILKNIKIELNKDSKIYFNLAFWNKNIFNLAKCDIKGKLGSNNKLDKL